MSNAFTSNEQFFQAVGAFAEQLEARGHALAAAEIREGLSCLNGLTDGWELLGESLESVMASHGSELTTEQRVELDQLTSAVWDVVHRR